MKASSVTRLINAACFLAILPVSGYALTPAQVFDKVRDSVVVVKILDDRGEIRGHESGVLISSGRIATNCYAVNGGFSYEIIQGKQSFSATLYAEDREKGICLLDAKGIQGKPASVGKAARLKVGDPVYAVGAPEGQDLSLSDGIVAQLRGGPSPLIQSTTAISPGSSGGGLFDGEGRLVGLITFNPEGGQSLNFSTPAEWINGVKPGRKAAAGGYGRSEWQARAAALDTAKDWQGLLDAGLRWTQEEPKNTSAWNTVGYAYEQLGRYENAVGAYRQAIKMDPKNGIAWSNLGNAYINLKRYSDAADAYRQALEIDPKDSNTWYNLGGTYGDLGRHNDAVEALYQAVRIDPNNASVWHSLGFSYSALKRYNDAVEAYRQAVRIDPKNGSAWHGLGFSYHELKRYNDAVEAYCQAVKIDPNNADAWNNLGAVYSYLNRHSDAIEAYRQAIGIHPADGSAWVQPWGRL